jgi:hypothetical protein
VFDNLNANSGKAYIYTRARAFQTKNTQRTQQERSELFTLEL